MRMGPAGADGGQDKCTHHYKHEPRLSEAPWRTKATMVPMLCQPGAPSNTRQGLQDSTIADALRRRCPISTGHEPKLTEAFSRTKVQLVLILYEPSAPRHNAHGPMLDEASARTKALLVPMVCKTSAPIITSMNLDCRRHLGAPTPRWYQLGAPSSTRQGPKLVQASARTKASLVLTTCETGAPRCTSLCLDCSRHLGN